MPGPHRHSPNELLARALVQHCPGGDIVRRVAADELDGRTVREWLFHLADDPRLAAAVAERSYRHPNGFAKLRLSRPNTEGWQVRLHVWPGKGIANTDPGDIHDHRWPFWSWVLTGELQERMFRSDRGEDFAKLEYTPVGSARRGGLRPVGYAHIEQVDEATHEVQSVHFGRASSIHEFGSTTEGLSATLVLVGPPIRTYSYVYRDRSSAAPPPVLVVPALRDRDVQPLLFRVGAAVQ